MNGLTQSEVEIRNLKGQNNSYKVDTTKSTLSIIKDNVLNLFIVLNIIIAICLFAVGSYMNTLFIFFVAVGVISGITIEIRARNMVSKLTLLNKGKVTVIRDGEQVKIDPDDIVINDILKLTTGEQIPSDSIVRKGLIEVNEALLTGESDLIEKKVGSKLLSGSYVTSGLCYAEVNHVGQDNYITKLAIEAKTHKPINSEILGSINTVAKFTSRIIIPLGLILLLEAILLKQDTVQGAVVSTSAALLGMLPKGLAVLTVIALVTAVFKLGKKNVLVQEIYSVETMAHIDTLCLDKTGTLTEGKMRIKAVKSLSDEYSRDQIIDIIGSYLSKNTDNSSTMKAIRDHFKSNDLYKAKSSVAFSSDRKWSSVYLEEVGNIILGAPEIIFDEVPSAVAGRQQKGLRVLGLGLSTQKSITNKTVLSKVTPLATIELEDTVRKGAKKTLAYLASQGIDPRIISGDNPLTVSTFAKKAGFKNYQKFVDTSALSDEELIKIVPDTSIFGRVSPKQKKLIISELKRLGKTVAMTGDGVNDILAMREADLSIAMAEGDTATKQVSNIVLLKSSFAELPDILFEGRRVVNNMSRVSSIFFIKTIYSFFLSILCALSPLTGSVVVFPFISIQITALDQILEGYPSFFLSFEEDKKKVTHNFLRHALTSALPNAILVTLSLVFIHFFSINQGWAQAETVTLMYYTLASIMLIGITKACLPLNKLRIFLVATSTIGVFVASHLFKSILHLEALSSKTLPLLLIIVSICIIARLLMSLIQTQLQKRATKS